MPTTLDLARRLLALSQSGLHFCREEYDLERYREVAGIAAELLALESSSTAQDLHRTWFVEEGYATPKIDVLTPIASPRQRTASALNPGDRRNWRRPCRRSRPR